MQRMTSETQRLTAVSRAVLGRVRETEATFLAAAVAYYAFVSLLPLLVLGLIVGTAIAGEAVATAVVDRAAVALSPAGEDVVRGALTASAGRGTAGLLGSILLVWGAIKGVRGLDRAVARVYETPETRSTVAEVIGAAMTLAVVLVAASVTVLSAAMVGRLLGGLELVATLGLPAVLVIALLPLYVLLPPVDVSLRAALPGTVTAAVGWSILGAAFGLYAAVSGSSVYGVLGGVLLVVTWLYLGALVLVVGAALNAELAARGVDRPG